MRGKRIGRSGGGGGSGRDNGDRDNDDGGKIGDDGKDGDDGGGGRRGSGRGNCNGNVGSADLEIRRGGKGLIPIPADLDNSPPSLFLSSSSASVTTLSLPTTAEAGEIEG